MHLWILVSLLSLPGCSPQKSRTQVIDENLVTYLAGVEMLNSTDLPDSARAAAYHSLVEFSGYSAKKAEVKLEKMREKPELWNSMQAKIISRLEQTEPAVDDTVENDSLAPAGE